MHSTNPLLIFTSWTRLPNGCALGVALESVEEVCVFILASVLINADRTDITIMSQVVIEFPCASKG